MTVHPPMDGPPPNSRRRTRRKSVMSMHPTPELHEAATKLQLGKLCWNARRALDQKRQAKKENESTLMLQCAIRVHHSRTLFNSLRVQKQENDENRAATKLQTAKRQKDAKRLAAQKKHTRDENELENTFLTKICFSQRLSFGDAIHGCLTHADWTARHINVEDCQHGLSKLISRRRLQTLKLLALGANDIGDDGLQQLAAAAVTPPPEYWPLSDASANTEVPLLVLSTLNLEANGISALGAQALAGAIGSSHLPALRCLCMNGNNISDGGMIAIASAFAHSVECQIEELQLADNSIGETGFTEFAGLCGSTSFGALSWLRLDGNHDAGDAGIRALACALNDGTMPQLKTLHASPHGLSSEGLHAVTSKRHISLHFVAYEAKAFWQGIPESRPSPTGGNTSFQYEISQAQGDDLLEHSERLANLLATVGVPAEAPDYGTGPGGRAL